MANKGTAATPGAMRAATAIVALNETMIFSPGTRVRLAEIIDRETAAPEMRDFIQKQYNSTNCICQGAMGRVQKLMGTNVACTKCEAEAILEKAVSRD